MLTDAHFRKYKNMLWKASHSMHRKYPHIEVEEFFGEATLLYCEAWRDYRPEIAKFSTYLHHRLRALSQMVRRHMPYEPLSDESEEHNEYIAIEAKLLISQLSQQSAAILAKILLGKYVPKSQGITKRVVRDAEHMRHDAISAVWDELRAWYTTAFVVPN